MNYKEILQLVANNNGINILNDPVKTYYLMTDYLSNDFESKKLAKLFLEINKIKNIKKTLEANGYKNGCDILMQVFNKLEDSYSNEDFYNCINPICEMLFPDVKVSATTSKNSAKASFKESTKKTTIKDKTRPHNKDVSYQTRSVGVSLFPKDFFPFSPDLEKQWDEAFSNRKSKIKNINTNNILMRKLKFAIETEFDMWINKLSDFCCSIDYLNVVKRLFDRCLNNMKRSTTIFGIIRKYCSCKKEFVSQIMGKFKNPTLRKLLLVHLYEEFDKLNVFSSLKFVINIYNEEAEEIEREIKDYTLGASTKLKEIYQVHKIYDLIEEFFETIIKVN